MKKIKQFLLSFITLGTLSVMEKSNGEVSFLTQMLSRGSGNALQKAISYMEKQQLAKAALSINKIITDPQTVHELAKSSGLKTASTHIVEQSINYIEKANAGTTIMKTNFLASVTTHIHYPVTELEKLITNPKISYSEIAKNTLAPVRTLVEGKLIKNFADKYDAFITKIELTNDLVKFVDNNSKENVNPDAIVTFNTVEGPVQKAMDIKMTNLDEHFLKGQIREINVYKNEIVEYPNNSKISLLQGCENTYQRLKELITFKNLDLKPRSDQALQYHQKINQLHDHLLACNNNIDLFIKKHPEIEHTLMELNALPGFPKTPTFAHIHHIQDTPLTANEMKFLELMANKADALTLNKESYMTNYLIESLKLYRELFDNKTYQNIKPLVKIYPWIKRGLGHAITQDFYLK